VIYRNHRSSLEQLAHQVQHLTRLMVPPERPQLNGVRMFSATEAEGYKQLTEPYEPHEKWMLANVVRDMAGVDFILVREEGGTSVWRKGMIPVGPD
jgi:hypothetical protein